MSLAVCLVSGGLDSCVAAACAQERGYELAFLHVGYGQRTQRREFQAFQSIARHYRVERRLVVELDYLKRIGGSALTDASIALPLDAVGQGGIPVSYVPFRNGSLLSIAAGWAEVLKAPCIYIGAVEEDSAGYPDCRRSFFEAFNAALREGTKPETQIEIVTPLIELDKGRIVEWGLRLRAPLHLTWSCYQSEDEACGRCDSCLLRLKGFAKAGAEDSIRYRA